MKKRISFLLESNDYTALIGESKASSVVRPALDRFFSNSSYRDVLHNIPVLRERDMVNITCRVDDRIYDIINDLRSKGYDINKLILYILLSDRG